MTPAFSVSLDSDSISEPGKVITYDVVTTNVEEGYKTTTGSFVCPVSGFYLFTVTSSAPVDLYMNGDVVSSFIHGSPYAAGVTSIGALRCNEDSRVWVENVATSSCDGSQGGNTFMGTLLVADVDNNRF